MERKADKISVADLVGPWVDPDCDSGLIYRCKHAWSKPLRELSNEELSTLLRQRIAVQHILPIAKKRVEDKINDETEMYLGELEDAIVFASKHS